MRDALTRSLQRFVSLVALVLLAVGCGDNLVREPDGGPGDAPTDAPPSAAKELTAFSFTDAANPALSADVTATINGTSIAATVPNGTTVTALVATFTTTGASVAVEDTPQVSGTTPNDFSSPVVYTVTAADGTTQDYTVTVTIAAAAAKELTSFRFNAAQNAQLTNDVVATISGTSIAATVPFDTDVTALVATFTTTGTSVTVGGTAQVSGTTGNNFTSPVVYRVTAADSTTQDYTVTVTVASGDAKEITAFSFEAVDNPGVLTADVPATISGTSITATVPFNTNVGALVATFATTGVSVTVGGTAQISGTTDNDFSSPVVYTVTAADSTTANYTVTVTIAPSPAKELTSFEFLAADNPGVLTADVAATITGTNITATVPFDTDVRALVATFATTGDRVEVGGVTQDSGMTANDFSSPVTYTVFAADTTSQAYTVTVTVAPNSAKAITAFSFEAADNPGNLTADVTATVDETNHTIAATVPFGTNVTALVATFATTGDRVEVAGVTQDSGVTDNDFTTPVTYTVIAADATSQDYTVTITVAPNNAKAITAFSFEAADNPGVLLTDVAATITNFDIAATVPFGTDVTALVATFATTGARVEVGGDVQDSGATPNNFTAPVAYTVIAADATSQDYTVTVTFAAPSTDNDLTSFSFRAADNASLPADFTGTFTGTNIAIRVPTGTDLTDLVATFATTGDNVSVGATTQVSGDTSNNFSAPVTYRVTAQDSSVQDYVVTVTEEDYCGALADPAGGTVSVTNDGFVPSTATYACAAGRLINPTGGETRTCAAANTWTPAAPTCDLAFMVVKVGDGVTALAAGVAAQVVVEERRLTDGALGRTITLPTTQAGANHPLTVSGSADTEAQLSLSNDGRFVTLGGYAAAPGTAGVITANSAAVPRVAGRITASGDVDTSTLLDTFSGQNIRGVTSVDGTAFWAVGSGSGVQYATFGSTGTTVQIVATPNNLRGAHVIDGQLYAHAASALSAIGTGAPTTTDQTATAVPVAITNAGAIALLDLNPVVTGPDTLYVAADGGTLPGGVLNVRKFTFDGTAWTQVTAFQPTVAASVNTNRIAAIRDQGVVHLVVATTATSNNRLLTFVDDGVNMTPAATDLPAAGTNYVYRGIAQSPFAP